MNFLFVKQIEKRYKKRKCSFIPNRNSDGDTQ